MQGLEIEDQVQLANILKQSVQRLDVDLDEIDQGQRRLGRRGYDDEVESRIVSICYKRWHIVRRRGRGGV
jgi:hypothetical protein